MGDKELPIQVSTIALNNQEDNEGYPQQEQEIGVDKLQIMQFVHTTTGQDTIFAKIQKILLSHTHVLGINMGSHAFLAKLL